jgi:hypothetical protein
MWLKFTTGSRKPAASTSRIEEYSEEGGSMFFETYVRLYQATLHRITDDSYLQEISNFGKTCVSKISSISTCTSQTVKQIFWNTPLAYKNYKWSIHKYTFTYNLCRLTLTFKSLLITWFTKRFNPFQSNFSATRILPSSYLFWAWKRLVGYL